MREIKFRARCKSSGNWVYGYFCKDYSGTAYITSLDGVETSIVDETTLGQYSGFKDKNGTEIYEGDALYSSGYYCTVIWDTGSFKTVYNHPEDGETLIIGEDVDLVGFMVIKSVNDNS